jgi:hypothetical protein
MSHLHFVDAFQFPRVIRGRSLCRKERAETGISFILVIIERYRVLSGFDFLDQRSLGLSNRLR